MLGAPLWSAGADGGYTLSVSVCIYKALSAGVARELLLRPHSNLRVVIDRALAAPLSLLLISSSERCALCELPVLSQLFLVCVLMLVVKSSVVAGVRMTSILDFHHLMTMDTYFLLQGTIL